MPELPEVETMRRGLLPIVGSRIVRLELPPCACQPIAIKPPLPALAQAVGGRLIREIGRLGKRVLLELDDRSVVVIEPRMTGLVLLTEPPTEEHLRLRIVLSGGPCDELLFWDRRGLGTVTWFTADQFAKLLEARIGPDALAITVDQLRERLGKSRRPIKPALLDQKEVAGIGNLYAAEILFVSRIDPQTRCDRLTRPQWTALHAAIGEVLRDAILHEGSTLGDGTYRNALNDPGGYQNYHRVYDRAGESCSRCGAGTIRRIVQAQRSTFFCPVCQTKRLRRNSCSPQAEPVVE